MLQAARPIAHVVLDVVTTAVTIGWILGKLRAARREKILDKAYADAQASIDAAASEATEAIQRAMADCQCDDCVSGRASQARELQ